MSLFPPPLPVRLDVPGESRVDRDGAFAETFRLHGLLQVRGPALQLEWSGTRHVAQAGKVTRNIEEPVPVTTLEIPIGRIVRLRLGGRWWRPRLELWPADRTVLGAVPGGTKECLALRFARRDWPLAVELRANLELEQAEAALKAAERLPELPPGAPSR